MNTIDELMDKDPLLLSSQDIDDIIAYERKARANFEAGVKPKKGEGGGAKLDLEKLMANMTPSAERLVLELNKATEPKPKAPRRV